MYDYHIHMDFTSGDTPQEFLRKTAEAGVTGGAIISPHPLGYVREEGTDQRWENLLAMVLQFTSETPTFLPVFWIDPTDADISRQIEVATEHGVSGFKIICNHFYPKDILKPMAQIAETALRALTYDNKTIRHVCAIILLHDERLKPQEAALRRFLLKTDFDYQLAYDVLQVQICDNLAKNTEKTKAEIDGIKRSVQMIEEMEQNSFSLTLKELAVNGNDLKALGLQGKQIRDMLAFLLDHVIEQPKDNEKNILIQLALQRQAKKRII